MTSQPPNEERDGVRAPSSVDRRRPRAVGAAAVILGSMGVLLTVFGVAVALVLSSETCPPDSGCISLAGLAVFGIAYAVIGLIHITAAVGAWRQRPWGRIAGIVVAVVGFGLTSLAVVATLGVPAAWWTGLIAAAYGAALVGLWRWTAATPPTGP